METFTQKLRWLLASLLLVVGISAWGQETAYKTLTFSKSTNSQGVSAYDKTWSATIDKFTWEIANFNNNNNNGWEYVKCGRQKSASVATITTSAAIDEAITKVVVTVDKLIAEGVNSTKLEVASDAGFTTDLQTIDVTIAQGDVTYPVTNPAADRYYRLTYDCAAKSNGSVQISKVVYYYNKEEGPDPVVATPGTPEFTPAAGTYDAAQSVTITCADADKIYYTTDGSAPTAASTLYTSAITVSESTTLKAVGANSEGTLGQVATAEYVINTATEPVSGDAQWVLTAPADLATGDIIVIVDQETSTAASNNNGTESAPTATAVTLSSDKSTIASEVGDALKWEVTVNGENYQFKVPGTTNYLYCTNANNGVRVGSNDDNVFTIAVGGDNNSNYLLNTATSRYVGTYNTQDWRCYTTINNNIKGDITTFYKYVENSSDKRIPTTVQFPENAYSANLGTAFTAPEAILDPATAGSVVYSSSKEDVATVDAATGAVTLVAAGQTVITATFAETDTYKGSKAEYTLTVVDPNANDGSETRPYTVAEARAAIDVYTDIKNVYVKGIVSQIVTAYSASYGNITYNISDDGTTTADQLQSYRGKSYNGENFTSADDIQVGDEVIIYGDLTLFSKNSTYTYEFTANNQLVYNSRTSETPGVTVAAPVFSVEAGTYTEAQTVEITSEAADAHIYYTTDGTEPTVSSTLYSSPISITETTTLKAIAEVDGNLSAVTTAVYTINIVEKPYAIAYNSELYTKVTSLSQLRNGDAVIIVNETFNKALSTTQQTNNRKPVDFTWVPWTDGNFAQNVSTDVEKFILVKDGDDFYFYASRGVKDGYLYAASSGSNWLRTQESKDNNAKASIELDESGNAAITFQGTNTRLLFNSSADLFSCYGSNSSEALVQLYVEGSLDAESEKNVTVSETSQNYKTIIAPYDARFANDGEHAYIVTLNEEQTEANFEEVTYVPAGTPIIYKNDAAGTFLIQRAFESDPMDDVSANVLQVSRGDVQGDEQTVYVLNSNDKGDVGFYLLRSGAVLASGKCYLKIEKSNAAKFIGFTVNGQDVTGINNLEAGALQTETIYDLNGRKVTAPTKGLYIVGGKKVFIK